jgi:hypothetical protein
MLLKPEAPRIMAVYIFRMKSIAYLSRIRRHLYETFIQIAGKPNGIETGVSHGNSVFLC